MKLLLAGDVHGNTSHVIHLLDIARSRGAERIMQLGDFGGWEHTADGREFLDTVSKRATKFGIPLYWIDGNHDRWSLTMDLHGDDRDDEGFVRCRENVLYAPRGHRWTWAGTRFLALGGANSVDKPWRLRQERAKAEKVRRKNMYRSAAGSTLAPTDTAGTLWFPEEELTDEQIETVLADASPVDVLLTHDKSRASNPDWNRKDLPECWPNQDRVQRVVAALCPRLLVHGHLHWRYTDHIRCGDQAWTRVEGLAADPWSAESPAYDPADSWMMLELPLAETADAGSVAS